MPTRLIKNRWLWWTISLLVCAGIIAWWVWRWRTGQFRRAPNLSINFLILIGAVLVLIPIVKLFRSEERRALLSKCLLISLLVHVVLVMSFSAVKLSRGVIQYVREEMAMEVPINLEAGQVASVQSQVRSQISDIAAPAPVPAGEMAVAPAMEVPLAIAPPTKDLLTPQPTAQRPTPEIQLPVPAPLLPPSQQVELPRPKVEAPLPPQIELPRSAPVAAADPTVKLEMPRPTIERAEPVSPKVEHPGPMAVIVAPPTTRPAASILPPTNLAEIGPMLPPTVAPPAVSPWRPAPPQLAMKAPDVQVKLPTIAPSSPQPSFEPTLEPPRPKEITRAAMVEPPIRPVIPPPQISIPLEDVANRSQSTVSAKQTQRAPDAVAMGPSFVESPITDSFQPRGPADLITEDTLAQREAAKRQAMLESYGGSKRTEDAVSKALAYLSRSQQADGHWTRYETDRSPRMREGESHDAGLTGLAVLCYLAADNTPARGQYRQTIELALKYLLSLETTNGDFRGPGGSMYDQGIVTVALSEAAVMAREPRYRSAALRGAKFIVDAQNGETGGWRYTPLDAGDMSVTGWQLMALHSAQRAGFRIPPEAEKRAMQYLDRLSVGDNRILARYQLDEPTTPSMTAHAVFSRMVYGRKLSESQLAEASEFVTRILPAEGEKDFYRLYCTSLMLMQLQNDAWRKWNAAASDYLLKLQRQGGDAAGSWDPDDKWGKWGGRVYSTSMACLTLEVYYRYLPMYTGRLAGRQAAR